MNKSFLTMALLAALLIGCNSSENPFSITEGKVGKLHKTDTVKSLYQIFEKDSVVGDSLSITNGSMKGRVFIYEKGGAPLLQLTPALDSIAVIGSIKILDNRFKTSKGISLESTFEAVSKAYDIDKIQTTFSSVVVTLKNTEVYLTIDRKEMPETLRYGSVGTIEAIQIPGSAPIKNLMVSWNR